MMSCFERSVPVGERLSNAPVLRQLVDSMPHGVFLARADGSIHYANDQWNRKVGKHHSEYDTNPWYTAIDESQLSGVLKAWKELIRTGKTAQFEAMLVREDASKRLIQFKIIRFNPEPGVDVFMCHCDDITVRHQLAEVAEENERRLAIMLEVMSEGVVLQDAGGQIMMSNPAAERILGLTNEQLCGRSSVDPSWRAVHADGSDYPGTEHPAMRSLSTGASFYDQVMGVHKPNGSLTWISINSVPLFDGHHETPYAVVCSFSDITDLKNGRDEAQSRLDALHLTQIELEMRQRQLEQANSLLKEMADTDVLTGLKNRRCLFERLRAEIALAERNGHAFSFALLDVDFFKSINDTFGHSAGDEVLKRVSQALLACGRVSDFIARYGGEEFAVVMPNTTRAQAEQAVERMLGEIRRVYWDGRQITASAGVSVYAIIGSSIDSLIEEADTALYAAKDAGRNCVVMAA